MSITEITAAHASGVTSPTMSRNPAASSVTTLIQACSTPHRRPRPLNQRAVPAILPPPRQWLYPCITIVTPTATRISSSAATTGGFAISLSSQPRLGSRGRERPSLEHLIVLDAGLPSARPVLDVAEWRDEHETVARITKVRGRARVGPHRQFSRAVD